MVAPAPAPAPVRDNRRRPGESRRDHRRRLGNPRVLTFRVVLFFILFVAILVGGYFVVRWYANDNWYVALDGKQLVIYQGRPGGFWWFHPKVVDRTGVTTSQVLKSRVPELRAEVQEGSLADAKRFVRNLRAEYLSEQPVVIPTTTTTTTTRARRLDHHHRARRLDVDHRADHHHHAGRMIGRPTHGACGRGGR